MSNHKIYDAITIADAILGIAKEAGNKLTPMQLVKLTYIAHGWSLGLERGALFNNRIEAWKYGPVIPDLYQVTKKYGRKYIPFDLIETDSSKIDEATRTFLQSVYNAYKKFDGIQLSYLTHMSGTPWDALYRDGIQHIEIPDDLIEKHYKRIKNERQFSTRN